MRHNADESLSVQIAESLFALECDIVAWRRDFHRYPELGWLEFRTTERILAQLKTWGIPAIAGAVNFDAKSRSGLPSDADFEAAFARALSVGSDPSILDTLRGGFTGAVVKIRGGRPGPTVGFRADIDALPIHEATQPTHRPTREGFASTWPGAMHACGHDGHTAIGLALAKVIFDHREEWPGNVVIVFQPAEEGGRGAHAMAEAGVVDDCRAMLTWHLGGRRNITGFIVGGATGFAISRKFEATFVGRAAHAGSEPQKGRHALLGAATAALNLHGLPRHSGGDTRVNVGALHSGEASNIVPELAHMVFELRADSEGVLDELDARAHNILAGAAAMHELRLDVVRHGETPSATSDALVIDCLRDVAANAAGVPGFHDRFKDPGSDDATYFMRRVQERGGVATYCLIGAEMPSGHHTPNFDFDERALAIGANVLAQAALRLARLPHLKSSQVDS